MAALVVVGLLGVVALGRRDTPRPSRVAAPTRARGPGAQGELSLRDVEMPVPDGYVRPDECPRATEPWRFPGSTRDQVLALGATSGASPEALAAMGDAVRCDASGCEVTPTAALVEALGPTSRSALYLHLRGLPGNRLQRFAYHRPRAFGPWHTAPGLSPRVRELLARGTWQVPEAYLFSDVPWLCNALDTDEARVEAVRALRTRYGLEATLRVGPGDDLDALADYWSEGGDWQATRDALAAARREGRINVRALLPDMPRRRLGTFAAATEPDYDCYWSAMHFFDSPTAPPEHASPRAMVQRLREGWDDVSDQAPRLGDLVAFYDAEGLVAHTASHVADGVVFTKNGHSHERPWKLMRLDDVRGSYPNVTAVRRYRRRPAP